MSPIVTFMYAYIHIFVQRVQNLLELAIVDVNHENEVNFIRLETVLGFRANVFADQFVFEKGVIGNFCA